MTDTTQSQNNPARSGNVLKSVEFIRSIGLIFSNAFLYGREHSVTRKSIEDCYGSLNMAIQACDEITLSITEDGLVVNDVHIEQKSPLMRMLVTQLTGMEIDSFSIKGEMSRDKFQKFVEIMNARPEDMKQHGGFSAALSNAGLDNVYTRKISYQQVAEDEVVVSKEEAKGKGALEDTARVDGILAFLRGDISAEDEKNLQVMEDIATDAERLGELILRAAEVRKQAAEMEGGESFGDLIVGCLRRTYEALLKDESIKTQAGKKKLRKTLMLMEKDVLEKMREMAAGNDEDMSVVSEAVGDMKDELEIDAVASDYMKKRAALEANEKRLLRFIKSRGADKIGDTGLEQKLIEGGLTPAGWEDLVVRSGSGAGSGVGFGEGGGGIDAIGHLAKLLARLQESIDKAKAGGFGGTPKEFLGILTDVDDEMKRLVARAENKIVSLIENVKTDEYSAVGGLAKEGAQSERHSRKSLLALFAEIVQEFCQPLSVITCSIDMIRNKNLGTVPEQQIDMLNLAASSGERLRTLIEKMLDISGLPKTMTPDKTILSTLYGPDSEDSAGETDKVEASYVENQG